MVAPLAELLRVAGIDVHAFDKRFRNDEGVLRLLQPSSFSGGNQLLVRDLLDGVFQDAEVGVVFLSVAVVFETDGGKRIAVAVAVEEGAVAVVDGP